ncbi:DUF4040 domain-containing protein [Verticiella sediminum]|uniref:DUF4040 domain-containing protein n=1 Tax=Verticiella sediminum TaxID=1247510 RepID=A0A556ABV7_9BURK|nr:hydrogenase subunit MbhD domain-containing protein [Verticiella sediminum]TSH90360.1 DUF4040 domain-containing protein [Verticiella sediminum]
MIRAMNLGFDLLLAAGLVYVAWRALGVRDLFTAIVLFIAFGLLMALCWVRLDAPDIALAEAAIGAGLTGALLLDALGHLSGRRAGQGAPPDTDQDARGELDGTRPPRMRDHAAAGVLGLFAGLIVAGGLWFLPIPDGGAYAAMASALDAHPVSNAVTAVLLDLRAYDTFLEMGVLALAALGALMLRATAAPAPQALPPARTSRLLPAIGGVLVPFMLMAAVYLYWAGTGRSGGAFPAGAILAAACVLLFLSGTQQLAARDHPVTRSVLALGLVAFLAAGWASAAMGGGFLQWPQGWVYPGILALEGVLTLAIGGMLAMIYTADAQPPQPPRPPRESP